jgi:hypothetical protein
MTSHLVTLGLVSGLVVAKVPQKLQTQAEVMATKNSMHAIAHTIHLHAALNDGDFNTSDMRTFVQQEMKREDGKRPDLDAWGHPLQFAARGRYVTIVSAGPDGQTGTADDIKNRVDVYNY